MAAALWRALGFLSVPDLRGKTAIVTGGNSGIGYEVVKAMACGGARVIVASRSAKRMQAAVTELARADAAAAERVETMVCDLESLRGVREFADKFLARQAPLNVLVNAAGRFLDTPPNERPVTEDGFEQTHAANFWGHAYLTLLLLPRLAMAAPAARIVSIVSFGEAAGKIRLGDLRGLTAAPGAGAYCDSKLLMYVWLSELDARLRRLEFGSGDSSGGGGGGIDCFATHPGFVATPLTAEKTDARRALGLAARIGARLLALPPSLGCVSTLYAATEPSLEGLCRRAPRAGAPYFGPPYALGLFAAPLPPPLLRVEGAPWAAQARDESLRAAVAVWREVRRTLEEAVGGGVPDVRVAIVTPDVGRAASAM